MRARRGPVSVHTAVVDGQATDDVRPGSVTATSTNLSEAWKGASKEPNLLINSAYLHNNNPPAALPR